MADSIMMSETDLDRSYNAADDLQQLETRGSSNTTAMMEQRTRPLLFTNVSDRQELSYVTVHDYGKLGVSGRTSGTV